MSSIAAPNATDAGRSRDFLDLARTILATVTMIILLVSVTPFLVEYEGGKGGNVLNQLVYSSLAAIAVLGHVLFTDRQVALSLLRPAWLILAGWLVLSGVQAHDPQAALRAVLFTLLAMVAATGVLCLPPTVPAFRRVLVLATLAAIGLSYLGVVAIPGIAIHSAGPVEGQHAGLWRGAYSHKNVAGAVMAMMFFFGLYFLRTRLVALGLLVMAACCFFMLQAGSKTALGLLPIVAFTVLAGRWFGGRALPVVLLSIALVVMALLTLGAVMVPALNDLLQQALPGTTFTGRTAIWDFALKTMAERQWTGWGFESFWRNAPVLMAEPGDTLTWDPRGTPNGHSGYLDTAIAIGWPGLAIVLVVLVVLPLRDYLNAPRDTDSSRLADLFLMMLAFVLLNAFLESFLFDRANPIWMSAWLAIVGLRLLSAHRLTPTALSARGSVLR